MRKLLAVILVMSVLPVAYGKQKKKRDRNEILYVGVHHTVCFGQCPDYSIEINKKNIATFTAYRFNSDTGIFKKTLKSGTAEKLIGMCKRYKVDTCQDWYENPLPDLPGVVLNIRYKDRKKTIHNADRGPSFLIEIANAIDEAGKRDDNSWKKTGMPKLD